jgi:hypothetical protein
VVGPIYIAITPGQRHEMMKGSSHHEGDERAAADGPARDNGNITESTQPPRSTREFVIAMSSQSKNTSGESKSGRGASLPAANEGRSYFSSQSLPSRRSASESAGLNRTGCAVPSIFCV